MPKTKFCLIFSFIQIRARIKFRQRIDKSILTEHRQVRFALLMKSSSAKLSSFLRFAAAGTLLVWLSAVAMCQAHCCGDNCGNDDHADAKVAQHNNAANSHDGDKNNHHDDPTCLTLKSALQSNHWIALVKPDFGLAFNLNFLSTALSVESSQSETFIFRQPPDSNRVFTPEVCLGPAFHSLAPPALV